MSRIAKQASALFENWQDIAYIIDEKAHLKKGKQSIGVANQYAGTVGKNENSQVGGNLVNSMSGAGEIKIEFVDSPSHLLITGEIFPSPITLGI